MKILNSFILDNSLPKYLQLTTAIRHAIKTGQLLPNESLPTIKALSELLKFNRHTVMKGLAELIAEGWIESKERVGYQVVADLPITQSKALFNKDKNSQTSPKNKTPFEYRIVKTGSPAPNYPDGKYQFNFSGGQPDLSLFPYSEFKSHIGDVLTRTNSHKLGYGESEGDSQLIEEIKVYLRRLRNLNNRELVITNGSQEALFIVAQLLLKTGDSVAVEQLGYPPAWAAFKSSGAKLIGIEQDNFGIIPQDLEEKIKLNKIRLIYLTPLHQYPTTITLSIGRRMQIYHIACKYKVPIVEDDYDHEFHYSCQPLAPMASDDPEGLVIYLSTFSKIMFPGARIGFIAVDKKLAKQIAQYKLLVSHKGNVVMQSAVARWMRDGGFERHLRRITRIYHQRRNHAVKAINSSECFQFEVPDGGMALWLKLTDKTNSAKKLVSQALAKGIFLQHQAEYQLDELKGTDNFIRLGYAGMSEGDFSAGLAQIISLISKP